MDILGIIVSLALSKVVKDIEKEKRQRTETIYRHMVSEYIFIAAMTSFMYFSFKVLYLFLTENAGFIAFIGHYTVTELYFFK